MNFDRDFQFNSTNNCLLILCPGCEVLMTKCKFIDHCENDCIKREIRCLNYSLGCQEILSKFSMKYHLNYACNYKIKEICSCSEILRKVKENDVLSIECIEHCSACVSSICKRTDCPLLECPNKCGMQMHRCKQRDHVTEVCSQSIVPCINRWSGCCATMLRRERGRHLKYCVASVVACVVEWTRNVSGCQLYQRYMDEGRGSWSARLQQRLVHQGDKTVDREFSAAMSLRDEINLCLSLNHGSDFAPSTTELYRCTAAASHQMEECHSLLGRSTTDVGHGREASLSYFTKGSQWSRGQESSEDGRDIVMDEDIRTKDGWTLREMSKSQTCKSPGTFTFQCGEAVPRTEYSDHYRQHCDLSCQMDGWIEMSCPFASRGCTYRAMRLAPPRSRLVYHPLSNYYGVRYRDLAVTGHGRDTNVRCFSDGDLTNHISDSINNINDPINNINDPINNIKDQINNINDPINHINDPINNINDPISNINDPINNICDWNNIINNPINIITDPIYNINNPTNHINHPINNISDPINNSGDPINNINDPINNICDPINNMDTSTTTMIATKECVSLLQLPMEVLIQVCSLLDGCSLKHASCAHPRLQQAIGMLIGGYYVRVDWTRTNQRTWRSHHSPFIPSTRGSSSAARCLCFSDQSVGDITNHMTLCPFRGPLSLGPETRRFCLHSIAESVSPTVAVLPQFLHGTCHGPRFLDTPTIADTFTHINSDGS